MPVQQQPYKIFPQEMPIAQPMTPMVPSQSYPITPITQSQSQSYQMTNTPSQMPTSYPREQSSFSFPSNNSSFFNKIDNMSSTQSPIKKGGWKKGKRN